MGRPKDLEFWQYVEKTDGSLKCTFCGIVFKGAPSISRIKAHLAGIKRQGIHSCQKVLADVKEAAEKSIKGKTAKESIQGRNKRSKTMPSSSINEVANPILQQENQDMSMDEIFMQMEDHHMELQEGEVGIASLDQVANQTQNHTGAGQSAQLVETRGDELLTTELTGEEFETHLEEITSWLMDDNILRIGIYGMGGVGKTALAKHINNKLLKTPNTKFHHVYWFTVSIDSSIYKLQKSIAGILDLDLSRVEDEHVRAARLSKALINNKKSVLILDNVWSYFPLNQVGIPVGLNECKLLLTTRSLDVCQKMSCQKNIKVNPLNGVWEDEGWELFLRVLGHETTLSSEIEVIAYSIAEECKGLPLAIELIATKMRGVNDICEWRDAYKKLKGAITTQMDVEIFNKLKISYDNLNDSTLQEFFLYSALYVDGIDREELIQNLVDEGILEEMESRQAKLDRGHSILNRLEKVCLLERLRERSVSMHGLVRDMAIQIMKQNPRAMVKAGKQLIKMPNEEEWAEDLVRCSLVGNYIKEIPLGYSPKCPKLTTLLLGNNLSLKSISASFFEQLSGLQVLDLSYTGISELPSFISYLVNLSALLLNDCPYLKNLPSLAELRALKSLNLCRSGVKEVPQGMELCINLRYLDLQNTNIEELPPEILPKLSNLQFLNLGHWVTVKGEEVASLRKLEALRCRFDDVSKLNVYNESITWSNLRGYDLVVGDGEHDDDIDEVLIAEKKVEYNGLEVKDILILPKDVQELKFYTCDIKTNGLCLENATQLKSLEITYCDGMGCLLSLSSSPYIFQSLEKITIDDVKDLQLLFSRETTFSIPLSPPPATFSLLKTATLSIPLSPPPATFSLLKQFYISRCPSVKKLFPPELLPNLQNLENITVHYCENMVELIGPLEEEEESHESSAINSNEFNLPKLKSFTLLRVPKLKSICMGKMICNSLQDIQLIGCDQLKKIPFPLVLRSDSGPLIHLPSLQQIRVSSRIWWESEVELDHPNAKDLLSPFVSSF